MTFGRYLYLPRLQSTNVLVNAIRSGLALLTWRLSLVIADFVQACRLLSLEKMLAFSSDLMQPDSKWTRRLSRPSRRFQGPAPQRHLKPRLLNS